MGEIDRLRADLEDARAGLVAAFTDLPEATFGDTAAGGGRSVRDLLWHAGLVEDWTRRTVDQGVRGGVPADYAERARPGIAQTPEYLGEWLEQCRRPLLALLRRLPEDALDASFALAGGETTTARGMLERLAAHDRRHAEQIGALRRDGAAVRVEGARDGDEEAS